MKQTLWTSRKIDLPLNVLDELAARFLIGVYEAALKSSPQEIGVLVALGDIYTRSGLYERGLEVDRRLVALRPDDPTFRYNLACSQSLLGSVDEAFGTLERAVTLGYDELDYLLRDPDLANVRKDRRWTAFLEKIRELNPSV
jgi:tetratricopeptide (TPR) repeat protein